MEPISKSLTVRCSPATAYGLFTASMGSWWPLASHSVFGARAVTCVFEACAGGRITERSRAGGEALWGTVLLVEPGRRLLFTWHPGRQPHCAQTVSVSFLATTGGTRVDLEHSGWETLGDRAQETWQSYLTGWDEVLGKHFAEAANRAEARSPLSDPT